MTYLFCPLKPWFKNLGKRLTKSEKIYLNDTALLGSVLGHNVSDNPMMFGHVLENFIAMELTKQLSYKSLEARLYHFRTVAGEEVDFILEKTNGDIVAIEVKSTSTFSANDIKGLKSLKNQIKEKFMMGIVLYQGEKILPVDEKIYAVPLHYLWS